MRPVVSTLRVSISIAATIAMALWPVDARASEVRANFIVDAAGGWLPRIPPMTLSEPTDTPARTIPARAAPLAGGLFQFQAGANLGIVIDDRIIVPLIGGAFGATVGNVHDVVTSIDGSVLTARPASALMLRLDFPGFGARFHGTRWSFEARVIPALEYWTLPAQLTPDQYASLNVTSVSVRADATFCVRADPTSRVCAFIAPSIWEFGPFNGGSAGIRLEFGP